MITLAEISDIDEIFKIYRLCDQKMQSLGFTYWINYPKFHQIESDIERKSLFALYQQDFIAAVVSLDEEQFYPWNQIKWTIPKGKPLVVHRLAVHPDFQGQGLGKQMMRYAEVIAIEKGHNSIRLDASSNNKGVHSFYIELGYKAIGEIYLPLRDFPFTCYEKEICP